MSTPEKEFNPLKAPENPDNKHDSKRNESTTDGGSSWLCTRGKVRLRFNFWARGVEWEDDDD